MCHLYGCLYTCDYIAVATELDSVNSRQNWNSNTVQDQQVMKTNTIQLQVQLIVEYKVQHVLHVSLSGNKESEFIKLGLCIAWIKSLLGRES